MLEAILIIGAYAACLGFGAVYIRRGVKTGGKGPLWTGIGLVFGPPWLLFLFLTGVELLGAEENLMFALEAAYVVCALLSVVYFRRFIKTQSRRSLWTGLALLFGPPGALVLYFGVTLYLRDETPPEPGALCYMPSRGEMIVSQPQSEEDQARWGQLAKKYSGRVSTETFHKLSGGIFDEAPSNVDNALKPPGK